MSTTPNTVIQFSVQRMVCTGCGSEANASCSCGLSYVPKKSRAAEAIKANPEKSDRAIAADLGIADRTVNRARATHVAPEESERVGRDGKSYPAKRELAPILAAPTPRRGKDALRERVLEALMILSGLPPAEEVASYFVGTDTAVIVSERIGKASEWLVNFNKHWSEDA